MKNKLLFIGFSFLFGSCASNKETTTATGLKDIFKGDFKIGTAINVDQLHKRDSAETALIEKHFNTITPENLMKSMYTQPQFGVFYLAGADSLVEYAKAQNWEIVGHALVWHTQLPPYIYTMQSKDSMEQFFTYHINTLASRYDGKLYAWDVVNEAVEGDGSLRKTPFYNLLGEDYVLRAFELADKAAPNTKLYYNDYNIEEPKKRAGAVDLIKKIKAAGLRIDGVGIQGHWRVGKVPFKDIEEAILEYSALGIDVMFTELDIEVLPRDFSGADVNQRMASNPAFNPYVDGIPDSVLQQQAKDYAQLFELFLKHKDKIGRVTFWGTHDGQSWLNGWPMRGRTNYPLLFDRNYQPKPAYEAIIKLKK